LIESQAAVDWAGTGVTYRGGRRTTEQRRDPMDGTRGTYPLHHRPNWNLEFHLSFASSLTFP
jgi:hypothetical protein